MIGKDSRFRHWPSLFVVLILATQFEAASRTATPPEIIGTYFNEGPILVELNLISKDGREVTMIPFTPGRIVRAAISEGQTKVYIPSKEMATRRLLSTSPTPTPKSAPAFFERETRTFYFRIISGKVILIKPRDLTTNEKKRLEGYKQELQRAGVYNN